MKGFFLRIPVLPLNFSAITIFPFVFFRGKMPEWLQNHERIHLRQQLELLIIPFYIWYLTEFLLHWFRLRDRNKAYRSISFEKEAYENHQDPAYLAQRKPWSFTAYMKKKGK